MAREEPQQAFANSVRGDASPRRFELPTASVITCPGTCSVVAAGMPERPTRRIISHTFQQLKDQQNSSSLERQAEPPQGQRWAATAEWRRRRQQQREQEEAAEEEQQRKHEQASLAGAKQQARDFQTSADNPLHPAPTSARAQRHSSSDSGGDSGDSGGGHDTDPEQQQAGSSLAAEAAAAAATRAQAAHNTFGHLAVGSLEPQAGRRSDSSDAERQEQQQPSLVEAAAAAHTQRLQALEEQADRLLQEYPHGIPKRLLLQLRREGLDLPISK